MSPAAGVPWRPLAIATAVVLAVHAVALRGLPRTVPWRPAPAPLVVDLRPAVQQPVQPADGERAKQAPPAAPAATSTVPRSHAAAQAAARTTAVAPPVLAVLPASGSVRFDVSGQWRGTPASGSATLAWDHDGTAYQARLSLQAPPLAMREQQSTGMVGAGGLQPGRFAERQRSEAAAHFDRARGRIVFSSNRPEALLQPGAQDRLSLLLQLPALAAAQPARFVAGSVLVLQVAGTRDADDWRFTVEGSDVLALGDEAVPALRLARATRGPYDPRMELWLAPGRDYALVRLRLTPPGGDWLDMQWSGTDKR